LIAADLWAAVELFATGRRSNLAANTSPAIRAASSCIAGVAGRRSRQPSMRSSRQIVTVSPATFEFADLADWAAWSSSEQSQQVLSEMRTMTLNLDIEVWGPSPLVPQPVRSGQ
jgi:hypothetical protein